MTSFGELLLLRSRFRGKLLAIERACELADQALTEELETIGMQIRREVRWESESATNHRRIIPANPSLIDYRRVKKDFSNTIWSSLFLSGYAATESLLIDLCDEYFIVKDNEESVRDMSSRGLEAIKDYLIKQGVTFESFSGWGKFMDANKIRNCLLHAGGKVNYCSHTDHLKNYIGRFESIEIGSWGEILISKDYVLYSLDVFRSLFEEMELRMHDH